MHLINLILNLIKNFGDFSPKEFFLTLKVIFLVKCKVINFFSLILVLVIQRQITVSLRHFIL